MPHFRKLTPNLLVANVERSLAFYVDTLGFTRGMTVPEQSPFVFASVTNGMLDTLEIFFNDAATAVTEYPAFAGKPIGATGTLFIEMVGIDAFHDSVKSRVKITMPIVTQWYGMREFAIEDPDGYVITFAERVPQK
ncbi:MAG: VOC family protein [Acidobacteria bacterium]|nr:VOC family protein [Acidobacteriota bacterium]